jgi:nitrogen fixation protein FixH
MIPMNSGLAKVSRNLWPHAILAWFLVFASALAAWITFAVRQNMDLVQADYYEEEVRFQSQLDRLNRTAALQSEVAITHDAVAREVTLRLPPRHLSPGPSGEIHFYRPSNAALDVRVPLALDAAGRQRIPTEALLGGLWRMRVRWSAGGQEYFYEQVLVVVEPGPAAAVRRGE